MRRSIILLFVLSACVFHVGSQIETRDQKRIEKLLGEGFVIGEPLERYPYSSLSPGVQIDTSTTIIGDTTGVHYNHEYLLFRDYITNEKKEEVIKFIKASVVTVDEFKEFQDFVMDSIAREKLYYGLEDDKEASEYLSYQERFYDEINDEWRYYENSDREYYRDLFPLNWKKKFEYDDPKIVPLLFDMYLPPFERFYRKRIIDTRKLNFKYYELEKREVLNAECKGYKPRFRNGMRICRDQLMYVISKNVNVSSDDYFWAKQSKNNFDEYAALAKTYSLTQKTKPAVGILGSQARAFCYWKQDRLQRLVNAAELPYDVIITLPTKEDLEAGVVLMGEMNIPQFDYTLQWRISRKEYREFVNAVKDSISREIIYRRLEDDEEAKKFLSSTKTYFDEGNLEWTEYPRRDRNYMREYFSLNYKVKIKPEYEELLYDDSGKEHYALTHPRFKYYFTDAMERSFEGYFSETFRSVDPPSSDYHYRYYELEHRPIYDSILGTTINSTGKGLWLYGVDQKGHDPGIRRHENYQQFITEEQIDVLPSDLSELDDDENLIQSISYEQALAFYRWKYPIQNVNEKSDWREFVLPSREQFEKIKAGNNLISEEHNLEYPTPGFRYVVHLFPKR